MTIERHVQPPAGVKSFLGDISGVHAVNAIVGFIFAASGPVAIILAVGSRGGLSEAELASWIFGVFFINGLISIGFCLFYRQPLVFFWTIPGTVLIGPALTHLTYPEVIGAYLATGALMLALGLSGLVRRSMEAVPMPIVMGMVAGVFLQFGLDWIVAVRDGFQIAAPMTVMFFAAMAVPGLARRLSPLIAALVVGIVAVLLTGGFAPTTETAQVLAAPQLRLPEFSVQAMVELVIPLAITVLVVQNGQGIAILTAVGHKPPINAITVACGVGSLVSTFVGAVSTCLTGPVNAIISGSGERDGQYTAGVLVGLLALAFGLMAPLFTNLMLAAPAAFIATLAGLAMLRVLQSAFVIAFRDRFTLGALVTFLVTVSEISLFNIGAPFWGLVFGFLTSWLLERQDFQAKD